MLPFGEQMQALNGARFATRQSALRPAGRGAAPRTVAMATRKVNTFDGDWKKVSPLGCTQRLRW